MDTLTKPERNRWGSDASQFFDLYRPAGAARGGAVMIHGGFWRSRTRINLTATAKLCEALCAAGFVMANLEYRRTGEIGGGWPATFEDVRAGFRAALEHFADTKPVVVGHSAGGHLALLLATCEKQMAGVVALGPVAHLELGYREHTGDGAVAEFLGGTFPGVSPEEHPEIYDAADPVRRPSAIPRIVVHGVEDTIVPLALSRAFVEARREDAGSVRLVELAATGHRELIDPDSGAWPAVIGSIESLV